MLRLVNLVIYLNRWEYFALICQLVNILMRLFWCIIPLTTYLKLSYSLWDQKRTQLMCVTPSFDNSCWINKPPLDNPNETLRFCLRHYASSDDLFSTACTHARQSFIKNQVSFEVFLIHFDKNWRRKITIGVSWWNEMEYWPNYCIASNWNLLWQVKIGKLQWIRATHITCCYFQVGLS